MQKSKVRKILIVGAGMTGITLAEKFAGNGDEVLIIESRNHIGGNCYDLKNSAGILVHKYGPHIFHTNYKLVWDFLSEFTEWSNYEHKVLGFIEGKYVPIPFNLNTLHDLLPEKADSLEKKLLSTFGRDKRIPIMDLMKTDDEELKSLADFVYKKIFLHNNI